MELFGIAVETLGLVGAVIFLVIISGKLIYDFTKKSQEQLESTNERHHKQTENLISTFRTEMSETRKEFRKEILETRKEHKEDRIAFQSAVNDLNGEIQEVKKSLDEIKK